MTTGATLQACATALRQAGASHVWVLVLFTSERDYKKTQSLIKRGQATHRL
jgi:adenine/guanine phosphoribosyltransferase-like PRPP-binding protein